MDAEKTQYLLEEVLLQEVQCTERLLDTLAAEREALIHRKVEALETAVHEKLTYTQLLDTLDRTRDEIRSGTGFSSGAEGFNALLQVLPARDDLTRLWHRILGNIGECQNRNLINGGILEAGRQQIEQALRVLRGQHGSTTLYNPHGETPSDLGNRVLGKV